MFRNFAIAALATVVVATVAAPAFASYDTFGATKIDSLNLNKDQLINELHARGINASDADAWGSLVRAEVALPDGTTVVRFYQPDNFQPVNVDRPN